MSTFEHIDYECAIQDISRRTACPNCRHSLSGCSMRVVTQDTSWVVAELICARCGGFRRMYADLGPDASELVSRLLRRRQPDGSTPITADELIDVHRALTAMDGVGFDRLLCQDGARLHR
jgi:hypothetical protein